MTERQPAPPGSAALEYESILRDVALSFPESHEDRPWGERAIKVRKKTYVFMSSNEDGLHLSMKLPHSNREALLLPFTEPTNYGLGKSGWVTAHFGVDEVPPVPIVAGWIEESYRAVAPKKLVALLDEGDLGTPRKKKA
jgi:predicted DNA-binding protein (MmcQ/YjbR family)